MLTLWLSSTSALLRHPEWVNLSSVGRGHGTLAPAGSVRPRQLHGTLLLLLSQTFSLTLGQFKQHLKNQFITAYCNQSFPQLVLLYTYCESNCSFNTCLKRTLQLKIYLPSPDATKATSLLPLPYLALLIITLQFLLLTTSRLHINSVVSIGYLFSRTVPLLMTLQTTSLLCLIALLSLPQTWRRYDEENAYLGKLCNHYIAKRRHGLMYRTLWLNWVQTYQQYIKLDSNHNTVHACKGGTTLNDTKAASSVLRDVFTKKFSPKQ